MPNHPQEKGITLIQRWMQFAVTTATIVVSTVGCVWAVMVYALDNEYVQVEDFDKFKKEIKVEMRSAISDVHCASIRQKIMELNTVITFKTQSGADPALERLLRENQIEALEVSHCRHSAPQDSMHTDGL